MSEKITARHLARGAILYVRQSTAHQLQHNEESRRLQYAMEARLRDLGWQNVDIIDEDLGKSAAGTVDRAGFQRLVSEVSLGKVGSVGARELSRLARNSTDWQKLMEVCRYVDTLLVDHDAVYDLRVANDRLLLGLKGNLNEYELDLLRLRAHEAKMEKVRRGECYGNVAVGYRKTLDGAIEKHPDARVQHAVRLVFDKFLELGSARQVLLWMREHQLEVPINRNDRGDVLWKPARYAWLHMVLTNPVYAGSYVYGRTTGVATMSEQGTIRRRVTRKPRNGASVLLHDRHEGYIAREVFDRIQAMIAGNSQSSRFRPGPGAPRIGSALLAGLLRCRRCGAKLAVAYSGADGQVHRYDCNRARTTHGEARCISFSGRDVDERVAELVLQVVEPAAIEASLKLAHQEASQRDDAVDALKLELKAARYAADRAERQYDATEPENRLVADELERRWNAALERVLRLEARLAECHEARRESVDVTRFEPLGADVARVWHDPASDIRLKKRIVRAVIVEIVVDTTEREISIVVHWKGGVHTDVNVQRRRRGHNRLQTSPEIVEAVRVLTRVCNDEQIARALNASGIKTARGNLWTSALVRSFRSTQQIPVHANEREEWITLRRAAELVGVAGMTLKRAIERGVLKALRPVPRGPWILEKAHLLRPETLAQLTKRPRPRVDSPGAQTSAQLTLMIPRT